MCYFFKKLFRQSRIYLKYLDNKLVKMEEQIFKIEQSMEKPDLFRNYKKNSLKGEHECLINKHSHTYDKYLYYSGSGNADYSY